jgi:hypothetical protein
MTRLSMIAALAVASLSLASCGEPTARDVQARKGAKIAEQAMSNAQTNAEQDNIGQRLKLTSNPDLLGHIAIVNKVGQVVLYTTIKGKVTSGSKRLNSSGNCPNTIGTECPSDEGTFGSSNPYVFFWTTQGQYIQTSMDYIYSDKPLRLDEKPLMAVATTPPVGK